MVQEYPDITKSQIYGRPALSKRISQPLVSERDIEKIQEVRQQRFKQEQIKRLKREAEPIKQNNISKINQEISSYKQKIEKLKKEVTQEFEKDRQKLRERKDNYTQKEYSRRVDNLKDEKEEKQVELEARQKAVNELEKAKERYGKLEFSQILANKDYAENISDYAKDIVKAEVKRERLKQSFADRYGGLKERIEKAKAETRESRQERAMELAKIEQESGVRLDIDTQTLEVKGVKTPTGTISIEEYNKSLEKPNIAYRNIITGDLMSVAPEVGRKNPLLEPVKVNQQGEIIEDNTLLLALENPQYFPKARTDGQKLVSEMTVSEKLEYAFNKLDEKLARFTQDRKIKELEKQIEQYKKDRDRYKKAGLTSNQVNKIIEKLEKKLAKEKEFKEAGAVGRGPGIQAQAIDIAGPETVGFALGGGPLAVTFGLMYGALRLSPYIIRYGLEKPIEEGINQYKKIVKDKKLDKQDINRITNELKNSRAGQFASILVSNKVNNILQNYENYQKIKNSNSFKDFIQNSTLVLLQNSNIPSKEKLSKSTKTVKETSSKIWNSISEFAWKGNQLSELNRQEEEIKKERNEVAKRDDIINKEELLRAYDEYLFSIEAQKEQIYTQRGTNVLIASFILGGIGYESYKARGQKKLIDLDLKNFEDAKKQLDELKKIYSNPAKIRGAEGRQVINRYIGDASGVTKREIVENLGQLDYIKNLDDVKGFEIVAGWEGYNQVIPELKKYVRPESLRTVLRDEIPYYSVVTKNKKFFKNSITYNVFYNDGSVKSWSVLARANKPITRFRNWKNAIKYGAGKKAVLSSTIKDSDIIKSIIFKYRGGTLSPTQRLLTRATDTGIETRKLGRIAKKAEKRLDPETYWGLSPRKSITKVQKKAGETKPTQLIAENYWFGGTRQQMASRTKTVTSGIVVDTSELKFILDNQIENLKKIGSKSAKKSLNKIKGSVDEAIKNRKPTINIDKSTLQKLETEQLNTIRYAQTSVTPSPVRVRTKTKPVEIKSPVSKKQVINTTTKLRKIEDKINNISDTYETKRFLGRIKESDIKKIEKDLEKIKNETKSTTKELNKLIEKLENELKELNKRLQRQPDLDLERQANSERTKLGELQRQRQRLRLKNRQIQIIETQIIPQELETGQPRPPTQERIRDFDIPSFGFPSDRPKKKPRKKADYRAYIPQVREKGKWKTIGQPSYKWEAQKKGIKKTSKDLSQSFRLKPTTTILPKTEAKDFADLSKYYKKKEKGFNVWIEKPKAKIDSPSEKRKLKKSRKKSKKEKEWEKKVNKYWGFK